MDYFSFSFSLVLHSLLNDSHTFSAVFLNTTGATSHHFMMKNAIKSNLLLEEWKVNSNFYDIHSAGDFWQVLSIIRIEFLIFSVVSGPLYTRFPSSLYQSYPEFIMLKMMSHLSPFIIGKLDTLIWK
mgnify:CR=1 FL=1